RKEYLTNGKGKRKTANRVFSRGRGFPHYSGFRWEQCGSEFEGLSSATTIIGSNTRTKEEAKSAPKNQAQRKFRDNAGSSGASFLKRAINPQSRLIQKSEPTGKRKISTMIGWVSLPKNHLIPGNRLFV